MRLLLVALLVLAPAAARAAGAADILAASRKVDGLLDAWHFGQADAALEALRKTAPTAPEVSYLDGYSKFMHGDYDGAAHALATAAQAANASPDVKMLADLAKEARDAIKDHKEERTAHIVIRYPAEDAVLVPYARDTLEAAYQALHDDLGFDAEIPIRVEFYRSPSDLAAVSSLSQAEVARTGTIALCKWARLMVTTPRALAYGYPWLDSINHELVHYAVSTLTGDKRPGLAAGRPGQVPRAALARAGGRTHPARDGAPAREGAALGEADPVRRHAPVDGEAAVRRGRDAGVRRGRERDRLPSPEGRHGRAARRDQARRGRRGRARRRRGGGRRVVARLRTRLARVHGRAEVQDVPGHRYPDDAHPQAGRDRIRSQARRKRMRCPAP